MYTDQTNITITNILQTESTCVDSDTVPCAIPEALEKIKGRKCQACSRVR
jgi:hypothetical protein